MRVTVMWNSIVYPLGISITRVRPRNPMFPDGLSISFLFVSFLFFRGKPEPGEGEHGERMESLNLR